MKQMNEKKREKCNEIAAARWLISRLVAAGIFAVTFMWLFWENFRGRCQNAQQSNQKDKSENGKLKIKQKKTREKNCETTFRQQNTEWMNEWSTTENVSFQFAVYTIKISFQFRNSDLQFFRLFAFSLLSVGAPDAVTTISSTVAICDSECV